MMKNPSFKKIPGWRSTSLKTSWGSSPVKKKRSFKRTCPEHLHTINHIHMNEYEAAGCCSLTGNQLSVDLRFWQHRGSEDVDLSGRPSRWMQTYKMILFSILNCKLSVFFPCGYSFRLNMKVSITVPLNCFIRALLEDKTTPISVFFFFWK